VANPTQAEVLEVLSEVFAECLPHHDPPPAPDDPLFGPNGLLDSMDLVNFVADVEEEVNDRWESDIVVADTKALSRKNSPFRSLNALAEYCVQKMVASGA